MKYAGVLRTLFEFALIASLAVMLIRAQSPSGYAHGNPIHFIDVREKVVALTFDDGPSSEFTPTILRILDQYQVKATFFMVGSHMEQHPEMVKDVLARGHAIGNHTFTHPNNVETLSPGKFIQELDRCEQTITRLTGKGSLLFRPPHGLVDGTILQIANEEGYQTILWTVSADHDDAPTPQAMAQRVLQRIRPGGIILAHDGSEAYRWKDVAATPLIISALHKQGYRFVTVPELLALGAKAHRR